MKPSALLLFCSLSACTVQNGKNVTQFPDGRVNTTSYLYASVGSKAKGVTTSPEGAEILELDDSVSLRNALTAGTVAYGAYASMAVEKGAQALDATKITQTEKTARTGIVTSAGVEKARIAADVEKTAILRP